MSSAMGCPLGPPEPDNGDSVNQTPTIGPLSFLSSRLPRARRCERTECGGGVIVTTGWRDDESRPRHDWIVTRRDDVREKRRAWQRRDPRHRWRRRGGWGSRCAWSRQEQWSGRRVAEFSDSGPGDEDVCWFVFDETLDRVTNPDGTNRCSHTGQYAGIMTMTIRASGGTVSGTAAVGGTSTVTVSNCTSRVTGQQSPLPGSTTPFSLGNMTVSGTIASQSFNQQITSVTMTDDGFPANLIDTFAFSGALNADNASGSLTITFQNESRTAPNPRVSLGTSSVQVVLR